MPPIRNREPSVSSNDTESPISQTGNYQRNFTTVCGLGKGAYGEVYRSINKTDETEYAVKKIDVTSRSEEIAALNEIKILAKLKHHAVVQYYGWWFEEYEEELEEGTVTVTTELRNAEDSDLPDLKNAQIKSMSSGFTFGNDETTSEQSKENDCETSSSAEETRFRSSVPRKKFLYIQMELCLPQTLKDWLNDPNYAQRERLRSNLICNHIADALSYLHCASKKKKIVIIHRDLKPGNIFLTRNYENFTIKVGDFGLAKIADSDENRRRDMSNIVGTAFYISPEIRNRRDYDQKTDIYSLGIIFYELLEFFHTGAERLEVLNGIVTTFALPLNFVKRFPEEAAMICSMISRDRHSRPNAWEVSEKLVSYRKSLKKFLAQEREKSTEDRWWEFNFTALKSNSGIENLTNKCPDIVASVLVDKQKISLPHYNASSTSSSSEDLLVNNYNIPKNDYSSLSFINYSVPLNFKWDQITDMFLFYVDTQLESPNFSELLTKLTAIVKFQCFQVQPNDIFIDLSHFSQTLKILSLRGVKIKSCERSYTSAVNKLALVSCICDLDTSSLITRFPSVENLCLLDCRKLDFTDFVTAKYLDSFYERCSNLMEFCVNFSVTFGVLTASSSTYKIFNKRNGEWEQREISTRDYRHFIDIHFAYDEVEKTTIKKQSS